MPSYDRSRPEESPYASPFAAAGDEVVAAESSPEPRTGYLAAGVWVPTLYIAEAVPYMLVASVSTVFYKDLGLGVADVAAYTSLLYLPWVIKPLWSPIVDLIGTERGWVLTLQVVMALALGLLGYTLQLPDFVLPSLVCLWLVAISSATHDMAADGFYMRALAAPQQAVYVGIRSAFYRLGNVATQGGLVVLAGVLIERGYERTIAWSIAMLTAAGAMLLLSAYHALSMPRVAKVRTDGMPTPERMIGSFFRKPGIGMGLAYLLLYRFPEAQLTKIAQPFLLDDRSAGGLALTVAEVGTVYGTIGALSLIAGGILGGFAVARFGLKRCLIPMAFAIHLPNLAYLWLAMETPTEWPIIATAVGIEQFGYGIGFASYMVYMLYIARGPHQTTHFAICTGLMALGMMAPGYVSGYIQEWLGYENFFIWVMLAAIPSFVVTMLVRVEGDFGRTGAATA